MKRMISLLLALLALAAALMTGCAVRADVPEDPMPCPENGTPLTVAELGELSDLFGFDDWYGRALTSLYDRPQRANIGRMFRDTPSGSCTLTDAETAALLSAGETAESVAHYDCFRTSRQEVDRALTRCFGLTLDETGDLTMNYLTYLPDTDSYYHLHTDASMTPPEFLCGYRLPDGRTVVCYDDAGQLRVVTLFRQEGCDWRILSHLPLDPVAPAPYDA